MRQTKCTKNTLSFVTEKKKATDESLSLFMLRFLFSYLIKTFLPLMILMPFCILLMRWPARL